MVNLSMEVQAELIDARAAAARRRREQSKRQIMTAAERLFSQKGYNATTVEAIAASAGVGPATVYNCFGTKGSLVAHLFREEAERLGLQGRRDLEMGLTAAEALRHQWFRLLEMLEARRSLGGALLAAVMEASLAENPPPPEHDPRWVLPLPAYLTEIIRHGQAKGEFRLSPDPGLAAVAMVNALTVAFANRRPPAEHNQFLNLFLNGLKG